MTNLSEAIDSLFSRKDVINEIESHNARNESRMIFQVVASWVALETAGVPIMEASEEQFLEAYGLVQERTAAGCNN